MEILSLIVAIIAVFIGPFISYKIAKRQLYGQYIIYDRQLWLKEVRDLSAEYLTFWEEFTHKVNEEGINVDKQYYESTIRELSLRSHKLFLLLNKNNPYQKEFYNAIHASILIIPNIYQDNFKEEFGKIYSDLGESSQKLFEYEIKNIKKSF